MLRMRRGITTNMGACVGYQSPIINHRVSDCNYDTLSKPIDQTFFDGKNYRWIIRCLNDGYEVSTDVIEFMNEFNNILQTQMTQWNGYSKRWLEKLHSRPTLSSYNTTKRAQIQTVTSAAKSTELTQTLCDAIQKVITTYKRQVDRMYPKERLGFGHKHCRSEEMEALFKDAYSDRQKVADKLQRLQTDEKTADIAVREAAAKCESLELNDTTEKSELSKAHDRLEKKESKLQSIRTRITKTKEEYNEAKETYRRRATEIYQQCRKLEEERLDQIQETLIAFNRAIHSTEYSNQQNEMYANLLAKIESEQNTDADLNFWAETYHVISLPRPSLPEVVENEEDQSVVDEPATTQANGNLQAKRSKIPVPKTSQ